MLSFATNMRAMLTTSKLLKFGYWKQSDCNIMGKHYIFTKQALGIDKFLEKKNEIIKQSSEEETLRFQTKMRELLAQSGHKLMLVFKQDLEKAIYVCQDKEEDIQLVQHLACKYAKQNAKLRFGSFTFGAVLMRMCYVLNKPDVAMQWVESAELGGLFSHPSARQVLMCLLYERGLHAQVLDVMDDLSTGRHSSVRHPRDCVVVALAAALKQGSEDSLSRGLALAQACHGTGWHSWRLYAIAGCVALKAARPDVALQLLTDTVPSTVTAVVNILMLAWCEVGRPDQALALLRHASSLAPTAPAPRSSRPLHPLIFQHTLDAVTASVQQRGTAAQQQELHALSLQLLHVCAITAQSLEEHVLRPLSNDEMKPRSRQMSKFGSKSHLRREGLMDESAR